MRRPSLVLAGVAAALMVAGCSLLSPPPGGTIPHPAGSEVVARVEWTGGFVPYEYHFTRIPRFTLLGDGRVIVEGPQIEIYPGPALPNLQVRRLTEEGIQSVLFRIGETGLFDESQSFNGASQFVADASTTVFTVHADDREVVVDVYALGLLTDPNVAPPGIPADELEAHERLGPLEADLLNLDGGVPADDWADPAWQAYQPDALRLLVTNVDEQPPVDGLAVEPLPWPGSVPPDEFGTASEFQPFRCGVVSGDEGETWLVALSQANELTRWAHAGHVFHVTPRPLLPDEPLDCGTAEG
jgi:hypothetical protein